MEREPLVSICIPTYNGEHLVPRALESCMRQTYEHIEIVVVDDCSKDKTREVVEAYAAKDPRIVFFKNEVNLGASQNFLKTFQVAKGYFVEHLGQDDWLDPNYIEEKVWAFQTYPEVRVVSNCMSTYIEDTNGQIYFAGKLSKKHGLVPSSYVFKHFFEEPGLIGMSSMVRKTDMLEQFIYDIPNKFNYLEFYKKAMVVDNLVMLRILALHPEKQTLFFTNKTSYNTLSHSKNFSKTYGWIHAKDASDRIKLYHIDRIGYEFFYRTQAPQYLFHYRVIMGYNVLGNLFFDLLGGRGKITAAFKERFSMFFEDYSFLEKLSVGLFVIPHIVYRTFGWCVRKVKKMLFRKEYIEKI